MMSDKQARIRELTDRLNRAARAYYAEGREVMSNLEYDRLYDELLALERETGVTLANSPTVRVGYEVVSELPKEAHDQPMLSLDKTKEVEALAAFAGEHACLLSWKLDGLTVVLTYDGGELVKAVTRGNGEIGEVVTANARTFVNLPLRIPYEGTLVLRGEAVIRYDDFQRINEQIEDVDAKYKNPRNLCSGSVRQLNSEVTAQRMVHFVAFSLVQAPDVDFENSREQQFLWLARQGFEVVEYRLTQGETMEQTVEWFSAQVAQNPYPSDGLVLLYDDIAYGRSLGRTAKFPRDSIAFKWADELGETTLREIEWSPSRTGLINPVAIFDPIELEGSTVSRASVHNVSILKELKLGIGDQITVYKANMIIPQIAENLTKSDNVEIPKVCPVCGEHTSLQTVNGVQSLYCVNPRCQVKHIKAFRLLVDRDALNIEGISEATIEKFIRAGFLKEPADLFHLDRFHDQIIEMEGFGEKSYANLLESVQKARTTTLPRIIYGLGIANIGVSNAKLLCRAFDFSFEKIKTASVEELSAIDGVGEVIARSIVQFFSDGDLMAQVDRLLSELTIVCDQDRAEQSLQGMTVVVTGSLSHFANRNELKSYIEERGGKVAGSVSSKTAYLINNDRTSSSSKNKKAGELGIPIISEEEFLSLAGNEHLTE